MPLRLICSTAGGAVFGAALGYIAGDTVIGILICATIGAIGGWLWERSESRKRVD